MNNKYLNIRSIAKNKERENKQFVKFLRAIKIPEKKVNPLMRELYAAAQREIDCTQCAVCCKELGVELSDRDIAKLAKNHRMTNKEFKRRMLKPSSERAGIWRFNTHPCPLLLDDQCLYYDDRPHDCRNYPHLDAHDMMKNIVTVMKNYAYCPQVFYVIEALKERLWKK